jgi:hypothetical protein
VEYGSSLIATVALLIWIPLSLVVFSSFKPHRAVAILLVGGAIFLPERETLTIPLLPDIDKKTIACAWAFFPAVIWAWGRIKKPQLGKMTWFLFGSLVIIDIMRAALNGDAINYGAAFVPHIPLHTAITFVLQDFLVMFVPFFLGATLFKERETLKDLLKAFAIAGLCYVPLVLIELRLSPQLHNWVYGFMQHSFAQVMREGGYRPMVFMEHGLAVALFLATCALCATGLAKAKERVLRFRAWIPALILTVLTLLVNSFGALLFLVALAPLIWFTSPRMQLRIASLLCAMVLLYPLLRAFDWVPTKALVDLAGSYSADRAGSLAFRFENEDLVLHKAFERPFFGWGGFGRIFVLDPWTGDELTTFDGAWLITYTQSGVLGFVARFGLMVWPVWKAWRRIKRVRHKGDQILIGALGVTTAMVILDLLPNGMFTYFPYLLAGALLGSSRELSRPDQGLMPAQGVSAPPRAYAPRRPREPTEVYARR